MKNSDYWKNRLELLEESSNQDARALYGELEKAISLAEQEIDSKISHWYQRFAKNNEISLVEAKQILNKKELEEFRWTVEEYINHGQEVGLNPAYIKQLENVSTRVHLSRLESLKVELQQSVEMMYGNQYDQLDQFLRNTYTESYYYTAFELQKGFGIGWDIAGINTNQIEKVITKPWTTDNRTFSDRIWHEKDKLLSELHTGLTQNIILGKAPDNLIRDIAKKMNTSKSNAGRLVMTESAYFYSVGQGKAFKDLDVEEYQVIATLDSATSELCQEWDKKILPMKEYQAGATAPPFHPNCRTVTIPYFADNEITRFARNEDGSTYTVKDMSYKEWKKGQENGILKSTTDYSDIPITQESVDKIPLIETNLLSKEGNKLLQEAHQDLLSMAQRYPLGTEVGATFDLNMEQIDMSVGVSGEGSVFMKDENIPYIAIHSHPDGLPFSVEDYFLFSKRDNLKILTAVGNDGKVYIIEKGIDYNQSSFYTEFAKLKEDVRSLVSKHEVEKTIELLEDFYKGIGEYGISGY